MSEDESDVGESDEVSQELKMQMELRDVIYNDWSDVEAIDGVLKKINDNASLPINSTDDKAFIDKQLQDLSLWMSYLDQKTHDSQLLSKTWLNEFVTRLKERRVEGGQEAGGGGGVQGAGKGPEAGGVSRVDSNTSQKFKKQSAVLDALEKLYAAPSPSESAESAVVNACDAIINAKSWVADSSKFDEGWDGKALLDQLRMNTKAIPTTILDVRFFRRVKTFVQEGNFTKSQGSDVGLDSGTGEPNQDERIEGELFEEIKNSISLVGNMPIGTFLHIWDGLIWMQERANVSRESVLATTDNKTFDEIARISTMESFPTDFLSPLILDEYLIWYSKSYCQQANKIISSRDEFIDAEIVLLNSLLSVSDKSNGLDAVVKPICCVIGVEIHLQLPRDAVSQPQGFESAVTTLQDATKEKKCLDRSWFLKLWRLVSDHWRRIFFGNADNRNKNYLHKFKDNRNEESLESVIGSIQQRLSRVEYYGGSVAGGLLYELQGDMTDVNNVLKQMDDHPDQFVTRMSLRRLLEGLVQLSISLQSPKDTGQPPEDTGVPKDAIERHNKLVDNLKRFLLAEKSASYDDQTMSGCFKNVFELLVSSKESRRDLFDYAAPDTKSKPLGEVVESLEKGKVGGVLGVSVSPSVLLDKFLVQFSQFYCRVVIKKGLEISQSECNGIEEDLMTRSMRLDEKRESFLNTMSCFCRAVGSGHLGHTEYVGFTTKSTLYETQLNTLKKAVSGDKCLGLDWFLVFWRLVYDEWRKKDLKATQDKVLDALKRLNDKSESHLRLAQSALQSLMHKDSRFGLARVEQFYDLEFSPAGSHLNIDNVVKQTVKFPDKFISKESLQRIIDSLGKGEYYFEAGEGSGGEEG
eukprot:48836-Hanusia_phi.AAC.2